MRSPVSQDLGSAIEVCFCVFMFVFQLVCVTVSIPVGRRWDQQSAIELTAEGDGQPISTQLALNI